MKPSSEIEIEYTGIDISGLAQFKSKGTFIINSIAKTINDEIILNIKSVVDGSSKRVTSDSIITIDGMEPKRLASLYNIKPDGSTKEASKRRGRKPKDQKKLAEFY